MIFTYLYQNSTWSWRWWLELKISVSFKSIKMSAIQKVRGKPIKRPPGNLNSWFLNWQIFSSRHAVTRQMNLAIIEDYTVEWNKNRFRWVIFETEVKEVHSAWLGLKVVLWRNYLLKCDYEGAVTGTSSQSFTCFENPIRRLSTINSLSEIRLQIPPLYSLKSNITWLESLLA